MREVKMYLRDTVFRKRSSIIEVPKSSVYGEIVHRLRVEDSEFLVYTKRLNIKMM